MTTPLTAPCAVAMGMGEEATVDVAGHQFNAHEFMQIKRMNAMLSQEIGLLCRVSAMEHHEALLLVVNTVVAKLLTRIPRETVSRSIREAYTRVRDYDAYYSSSPHPHLGRAEIDHSFPVGLTMIATPYQFVMANIVSKVLRDDDLLDDMWILLQEAMTAWLMLTMVRPVEDVEALCGLLPEEVKEGNVVQFNTVSVDATYDPLAQ